MMHHTLIQCAACNTLYNMSDISREYFENYTKLFPGEKFSKKDVLHHLAQKLPRHTYEQIRNAHFEKVSAGGRIFKFKSGHGKPRDFL